MSPNATSTVVQDDSAQPDRSVPTGGFLGGSRLPIRLDPG
jgi:hypothetical protein